MHLRQLGFIYSAWGPLTETQNDYKNLQKNSYQNKLDNHHVVYEDYKTLARIEASDKVLCDKALQIANNS